MFSNKGCMCCFDKDHEPACTTRKETQLKCCWEINTPCRERVLFTAPNQCELTAFGTIKYECSSHIAHGEICVNVYKGDPKCGCLIDSFLLDEGGCATFVLSDFNTITASSLVHKEARGEICITPIFKVEK